MIDEKVLGGGIDANLLGACSKRSVTKKKRSGVSTVGGGQC